MNMKLAITYGVLNWILIFLLSAIFYPIFMNIIPNFNITTPLFIVIVTGFFGILYIRHIDENEVVEGVLIGIVFSVIDIILDYIFFIIPVYSVVSRNYWLHIVAMVVVTLLITTFLGYLAQMKIDLK